MTSLRIAFAFLTVLPVGPKRFPDAMGPGASFFPLVGLAIGGLLLGLDQGLRQGLPDVLVAAMVLTAAIVVTRAIHIEGFLDSCDAIFGGYTRQRRLEILRDSHVGAFAVVGGGCLLLLQWSSLTGLPEPARLETLVLFPVISRWGIVLVLSIFPYARDQGMGSAFHRGLRVWHLAFAGLTAAAAAVLLAGFAGMIMLAAGTIVAWCLGWRTTRLLGGLTGDGYGATNEIVSVAVLILAVGLGEVSPGLLDAPVPL